MTVITTLKNGDGIIASKQFYSGTLDGLAIAERLGFDVQYIDFTDLKNLSDALKPNTKLIWTETCMNPTMQVMDIKAICDLVHANSDAIVVVDNTFLTPYYCRPLELGADIALYSLTKYFSGHSDILGGSVTMNCEELYKTVKYGQGAFGTMLSPFDCYLVNRSVKTLALRMEKHSENSYKVAKFLESHSAVEQVNHPALESHSGHKVAMKQFSGHSGVFSFYLKDNSHEKAIKFFNGLKFIPICTSLGGIETTMAYPREMSHPKFSDEECFSMGVTYGLIRISVGIEECDDIINDLRDALDGIDKSGKIGQIITKFESL
ncbi:putative cystathionine gamma-lyase 2 [Chironomus tepperi]|uniref:putative cystathionine gamma-lyase 2 n=1 Tax=Chironomus tepperi TaxID=113505 RepID=UPI00391F52F0